MTSIKKILLLLILPFCVFSGIEEDLNRGVGTANEITYDWLVGYAVNDHDTAHVAIFKKIFETTKIKTVLEYGLGFSTKFLLDNCNKVISVDVITYGYGPNVMMKFIELYKEYSNWIPIAYISGETGYVNSWAPYKHLGSEALYRATSYQNLHHKSYAKIDDFYITEFNAFVGHATKIRGDVVQILFDKVPIIVAHNTQARMTKVKEDDLYGYIDVVAPDDYEEIFFKLEGGTTVWIKKKPGSEVLIETLKKFREELQ
jgi:hypothetical protein